MSSEVDWSWKLREAIESIRTRYEHIGRKTGAPFLAVIYPPEAEVAVSKEWRTLTATLAPEFDLKTVNVLDVTMNVVQDLGAANIVVAFGEPMPGANPEADLGAMWVKAVADAVDQALAAPSSGKPVVVLDHVAALYPAVGPRDVMQRLWDGDKNSLNNPVVVLVPGTLLERKVYSFLNQREELMYRGDIL